MQSIPQAPANFANSSISIISWSKIIKLGHVWETVAGLQTSESPTGLLLNFAMKPLELPRHRASLLRDATAFRDVEQHAMSAVFLLHAFPPYLQRQHKEV